MRPAPTSLLAAECLHDAGEDLVLGPAAVDPAQQAGAFLVGQPTRLDAAIDLDLPVDEARRRLLARGRADDDPAVIDHRLALDAAEAAPLLELLDRAGLLRRIDGFGTEDEVFARILEALGRR